MYKCTSSMMFHALTLESTTVMEEEEPGIKHKDLCASGLMKQGDLGGRSHLGKVGFAYSFNKSKVEIVLQF